MSSNIAVVREKLVHILQTFPNDKKQEIITQFEEQKSKLEEREDLVWFIILQNIVGSFNKAAWDRVVERGALDILDYNHLIKLGSVKEQAGEIQRGLEEMARLKKRTDQMSERLAPNLHLIAKYGGPMQAYQHYKQLRDSDERMSFWNQFNGIAGKTTVRVMWMLLDDGIDHLIVTNRRTKSLVKKIAPSLGANDDAIQQFLGSAAKQANVPGWLAHEILNRYKDDILKEF